MSGISTAAIFSSDGSDLEALSLEAFRFQYRENALYRAYTDALRIQPDKVRSLAQIPFLPIQFFKTHQVTCGTFEPQLVFESSGTTQTINSRHLVKEAVIYEQSFLTAFERFYGPVTDFVVVGLLPSYLERKHSSLVYMVQNMVKRSAHPASGFYLYEHDKLYHQLQELEARGQKTLLIGVTFGLLDFAEQYALQLKHTIVMETGGMKGRREEWTREQVHAFLKERLGCSQIHAEYGMTELLSQAYSYGQGLFNTPPWMKVLVRDENDPFQLYTEKAAGVINVVDLANVYSCSFIATEDIGRLHEHGTFEVLGRLDNSALRGCSLMVS
ncbi:LuxE/PaaK family acyltransferase [Chitinophaga sancti]|uniref:Acyl transferase n=1 Tax=Chitinophaga sancti TaxID=1004 RepID=A0A1K1QUE9_9BACT|nr:acyl transferase [Chitinophaga sancti]WQD61954.1 acyl transferase [Chitinophaga sancti]WQG92477.1 acyl transferase [Chitinophaga sancti]SFW63535.1 Acyl-protein synthetase, LuxE [Chitinophaga sancti]